MQRRGLALSGLAAVTLWAAAGPAAAANWVLVGTNNSGSTYELDHDSFNRKGQEVTVSLRVHYGKPSDTGSHPDGFIVNRKVYCGQAAFQDLHTDYYREGSVVSASDIEERLTAKTGSIAEAVIEAACAR